MWHNRPWSAPLENRTKILDAVGAFRTAVFAEVSGRKGNSLKRFIGIAVVAFCSTSLFAAGDDFYQRMLQRGLAHYAEGSYATAIDELRLAAFGLVDSLDQFETAHVYIAVAAQKLNREPVARASLQRILAAEKIEHHLAALTLSNDVRQGFETAARTLLRRDELGLLRIGAVAVAAPPEKSQPQAAKPPQPPAPQPPGRQPGNASAQPSSMVDVALADAERAIAGGDLDQAGNIYRQALEVATLSRASLLRIGEGFYRVRDFRNALRAFSRILPFMKSEEPYRYYEAVSLFETGNVGAAKRELAAALPFIEVTPDVARYQARIEAAQ